MVVKTVEGKCSMGCETVKGECSMVVRQLERSVAWW